MIAYSSIKERLNEEYDNLKNALKDMSVKAKKIATKEIKTNKTPRYEPLSFVKLDSEIWVKSIFEILRLIFEVNLKAEIDAKLKAILNWSVKINEWEEEIKSNLVYSVSDEIYGKEFELCKIPTQTLKKVKELERKVQFLAETVINYQNVSMLYFFLSDTIIIYNIFSN